MRDNGNDLTLWFWLAVVAALAGVVLLGLTAASRI